MSELDKPGVMLGSRFFDITPPQDTFGEHPDLSKASRQRMVEILCHGVGASFFYGIPRALIGEIDSGAELLIGNSSLERKLNSFGWESIEEAIDPFSLGQVYEHLKQYNSENPDEDPGCYVYVKGNTAGSERNDGGFLRIKVLGAFQDQFPGSYQSTESQTDNQPVENGLGRRVYEVAVVDARAELTDSLTGAYNPKTLDIISPMLDVHLQEGHKLAIVMADCVRLKKMNDDYGHSFGSRIIKMTSDSLTDATRSANDLVIRAGGDEFFVLMEDVDQAEAARIVNRIDEEQNKYLLIRNQTLIDNKADISDLPDRIFDCGVLTSDSELFNSEKAFGQPVTVELMRSVVDKMNYAYKDSGKIADKVKALLRNPSVQDTVRYHKEIIEEVVQDTALVEIVKSLREKKTISLGRLDYYNNVCERLGTVVNTGEMSVDELSLFRFALQAHEVCANISANGQGINEQCERQRVPDYSKLFLSHLYSETGYKFFEDVARVVVRHHERPDGLGYPNKISLDVNNPEDKMANMINIIDAYYAICNRNVREQRDEDPLETLRSNSGQFAPNLVELLVPILIKTDPLKTSSDQTKVKSL